MIKFNVEITDATGLIPATIFAEKAEELYNIIAAEMVNNTTNVCYTTPSSCYMNTPKLDRVQKTNI